MPVVFPSVALITAALAGAPAGVKSTLPHPHPFSVHDLVAMQRLSEPQLAPDGKRIVFTVRTTDMDDNRGRTDVWIVNIDGGGLRQLTLHQENDSSPAWDPDGKAVLFLSTRSGSSEVWRLPLDGGGEASKVTNLPLDVNAFSVSPKGGWLLVSMAVFPDCASLTCTTQRLDELGKRKASGRLYGKLPVRHWDEWLDGRRNHLFVVPAAGGQPVDLMKGMDADCPSRPFGGTEEFTFTPDGNEVVFSAKIAGADEAWSTNFDLFVVPAFGNTPAKNLTAGNRAWDTSPAFSPDGKRLIYLAMTRPGYEADRYRLMLRDWPSGTERELSPQWDRSPSTVTWSRDGKSLLVDADDLGNHSLFVIDGTSGVAKAIVSNGSVSDPVQLADGRIAFLRNHVRSPNELFVVNGDGTNLQQITRMNAKRLAATIMGEPEQFTFVGAQGDTVYAWLVKPADFRGGKTKHPVALLIHGGPQSSFGNDFHYRWNPQTYAGRGYAAIMIDFHGSTGYGQKFTDAIVGDWGGKPLDDIKAGLAAALEKYPFLDGNRVAALGASYGAYMINWIAGAWPDRFRCLVSHDGNLDERAAYYDTEELWFPEWDHQGTPWENPDGYAKHNPVSLVAKWKTPILVVHGGRDFRVVETQGMSTFTAAQRRGIPSSFLYFPDENHWVLRPHNSVLWHETVLSWLDRWVL
ncbi:MAG: S9 family peptidase [Pseudomonadota bacterium]